MTTPPTAAVFVVGAGPGIGSAVARRFGREGHPVGLIARNRDRLAEQVVDLEHQGVRAHAAVADIRDVPALHRALDELTGRLGAPSTVLFSPHPDVSLIKSVLQTTAADLRESYELNVVGAAALVEHVAPAMRERGAGTLLFTTGSAGLDPQADRASAGITTSAETLYLRLLRQALQPDGVAVKHTVIVGAVGEGKTHEPADIAEHLWAQHTTRGTAFAVIR